MCTCKMNLLGIELVFSSYLIIYEVLNTGGRFHFTISQQIALELYRLSCSALIWALSSAQGQLQRCCGYLDPWLLWEPKEKERNLHLGMCSKAGF